MQFDWSPEEEAFRQEVRAFLAKELTDEVRGSMFIDTPARVAFVDKMAQRGWLGMGFPQEYGGSKKPIALAQFILNVELELADAPIVGKNIGVIANTIYHEGSEAMKREFLPKIFANRCQWALTYTEPGAGTDLASLQCAAVDKGDHFEVTGTKLFITSAHFANYHWIAVRTDPDAPQHKGISILIMDADAEGLSFTPMWCVGSTGAERTNEVHLDRVKVPKSRLVGELNKGFYYMMQALDYERFAIIGFAIRVRRFRRLVDWVKQSRDPRRKARGRSGDPREAGAPGHARGDRHHAREALHLRRGRTGPQRRGRDEQGLVLDREHGDRGPRPRHHGALRIPVEGLGARPAGRRHGRPVPDGRSLPGGRGGRRHLEGDRGPAPARAPERPRQAGAPRKRPRERGEGDLSP